MELKLAYFGHIKGSEDSSEKTVLLGKIESARKRRKPKMRWIGSREEAMGVSLQELSGAVEMGMLWSSLIPTVTRSRSRLNMVSLTNIIQHLPMYLTPLPFFSLRIPQSLQAFSLPLCQLSPLLGLLFSCLLVELTLHLLQASNFIFVIPLSKVIFPQPTIYSELFSK